MATVNEKNPRNVYNTIKVQEFIYQSDLDSKLVQTTGDQTIAGEKTFTDVVTLSSPLQIRGEDGRLYLLGVDQNGVFYVKPKHDDQWVEESDGSVVTEGVLEDDGTFTFNGNTEDDGTFVVETGNNQNG